MEVLIAYAGSKEVYWKVNDAAMWDTLFLDI